MSNVKIIPGMDLPTFFMRMQAHFKTVLHEPLHIRACGSCDLCGEEH
jgi:hypothetical protein